MLGSVLSRQRQVWVEVNSLLIYLSNTILVSESSEDTYDFEWSKNKAINSDIEEEYQCS